MPRLLVPLQNAARRVKRVHIGSGVTVAASLLAGVIAYLFADLPIHYTIYDRIEVRTATPLGKLAIFSAPFFLTYLLLSVLQSLLFSQLRATDTRVASEATSGAVANLIFDVVNNHIWSLWYSEESAIVLCCALALCKLRTMTHLCGLCLDSLVSEKETRDGTLDAVERENQLRDLICEGLQCLCQIASIFAITIGIIVFLWATRPGNLFLDQILVLFGAGSLLTLMKKMMSASMRLASSTLLKGNPGVLGVYISISDTTFDFLGACLTLVPFLNAISLLLFNKTLTHLVTEIGRLSPSHAWERVKKLFGTVFRGAKMNTRYLFLVIYTARTFSRSVEQVLRSISKISRAVAANNRFVSLPVATLGDLYGRDATPESARAAQAAAGPDGAATCPICLEEFTIPDEGMEIPDARKLSCGHIFHLHCIQIWMINGKAICPLCNTEIFPGTNIREMNADLGHGNPAQDAAVAQDVQDAILAEEAERAEGAERAGPDAPLGEIVVPQGEEGDRGRRAPDVELDDGPDRASVGDIAPIEAQATSQGGAGVVTADQTDHAAHAALTSPAPSAQTDQRQVVDVVSSSNVELDGKTGAPEGQTDVKPPQPPDLPSHPEASAPLDVPALPEPANRLPDELEAGRDNLLVNTDVPDVAGPVDALIEPAAQERRFPAQERPLLPRILSAFLSLPWIFFCILFEPLAAILTAIATTVRAFFGAVRTLAEFSFIASKTPSLDSPAPSHALQTADGREALKTADASEAYRKPSLMIPVYLPEDRVQNLTPQELKAAVRAAVADFEQRLDLQLALRENPGEVAEQYECLIDGSDAEA